MLSFSIITAVKNGASQLQRTIDSVASQTYPHRQHIIIDGASTDGTVDLIHKNAGKIAFWSSEPDAGISDAFNKGIAKATGDVLQFLNCGDTLVSPDTLVRVAAEIGKRADPSREIFYGNADFIYPAYVLHQEADHALLPDINRIYHQAVFVGRAVHSALKYDERLWINMDYDMWLRALGKFDFVKLDMTVCNYYTGGISYSPKIATHKIIENRIVRHLNTRKALSIATLLDLVREIIIYKTIKAIQSFRLVQILTPLRSKLAKKKS